MNIDDHPQIAGQLGIQSIPAVIAFKNGQPLDGFMGALPESQVHGVHRARRRAGRPERARSEALEAAAQALAAKDFAGAAGLFSDVLQDDPDNLDGARRPGPLLRRAGRAGAGARAARRADAGAGEGRRRSPARAPRSSLPRRPRSSASPSDLAAPPRSGPERPPGALRPGAGAERAAATAPAPPSSSSRSSAATAPGTRRPRASSSCSSSRPGA